MPVPDVPVQMGRVRMSHSLCNNVTNLGRYEPTVRNQHTKDGREKLPDAYSTDQKAAEPTDMNGNVHLPDPTHVLVVLPALNEEEHIEACIRSLISADGWASHVKVVVADGGSADRTRDVIRGLQGEFTNLVIADNPGRLQSAGVNTAVLQQAGPERSCSLLDLSGLPQLVRPSRLLVQQVLRFHA